MITHILQRIIVSIFRLWLITIETSQIRLSMNFYSINLELNQLLDRCNLKSLNLSKNQQNQESKVQKNRDTQLDLVRKNNIVKVAIVDNRAFWVRDNKFWTSKIVDGYIDDVSAEEIDAHNLSNKELYMLLEILDELNS